MSIRTNNVYVLLLSAPALPALRMSLTTEANENQIVPYLSQIKTSYFLIFGAEHAGFNVTAVAACPVIFSGSHSCAEDSLRSLSFREV